MNTFGASAYLKAERDAVTDTLRKLQERLRKLKMEELSIRAEIRFSMAAGADGAAADEAGAGTSAGNSGTTRDSRVWTQNLGAHLGQQQSCVADEMAVNEAPLELDIDEALKIIGRYKREGTSAAAYEDGNSFFDPDGIYRGGRAAEESEDVPEEVEEEEQDEEEDSVEFEEKFHEPSGSHGAQGDARPGTSSQMEFSASFRVGPTKVPKLEETDFF